MSGATAKDIDSEIIDAMELFVHDPKGFVYYAYPWDDGTNPDFTGSLKGQSGPDKWQADILDAIGNGTLTMGEAVRIAVASGHGIGKTALIAWIIDWFISTRPNPQIVVTANTKVQLETKTWRELAKWWKLSVNRHWFNWTATKFSLVASSETWFASAIPWNKDNSEAFAGTHEKHVLVIYDEASKIDDVIWEVSEGAMTTPGAVWIAFGNPTKNTGRFKECFGKFRHRWICRQIDSRSAKMTDKKQLKEWVDDYGEDSDFVRVRVRGVFPRAGDMQFISTEVAEAASRRVVTEGMVDHAPVIIGADPARFGDDQSVIYVRKGIGTLKVLKYRGLTTVEFARLIIQTEDQYEADAVFIDGIGIGAGVVDYMKDVGREPIDVNVGTPALKPHKYMNLRVEIWDKMKEWLKVGAIPDDQELVDDLTGIEYGYDNKQRLQLESKKDMKKRGLASPDVGDALAMTFTSPVEKGARNNRGGRSLKTALTDYEMFD